MTPALVLLGLAAGVLTTLAGQGGGLFLLSVCSFLCGPEKALAITAPALLLGNLHRAYLFRRFIARPVATRVILGALPGAIIGGLLVGAVPSWVLQVSLLALTAVAIAKALRLLRFDVPPAALVPSGFVIGTLTGTAGGAGVLLSPMLLSAGLTGNAFVGTISAIAVVMHAGRVISYAGLGLLQRELFLSMGVVAVAIFVGNAAGERLRSLISPAKMTLFEYATLVVCVTLSVAGLG